jgi:signal transduction histidine kinase
VQSPGERASPALFEGGEHFAACVAHELRTPIALQRALVEVTLADPDADAAALRQMGERVVASCARQQRLIDALLGLVRSGRGPARREPVDIAAIAAEALRAHDLSELGSVVVLERAWTTGDPDLLERLAANLVSNAIRHNIVDGRIGVATRAGSGRAVLSVANTGPPIPAGELQRLFQPFQRLAPHPPGTGEGVGLGLAIVQVIADGHDAVVTAQARPGGGLRIDVGFPAAAHTGSAAPAARSR